ncbi:MAG: NAD(P)/FAD-dependent oxidoreductase [Alphaproteobacteria bacterium]|nr:NAD(P)/FAD-dependent oxidoreductase [Alphaproteobacteria bacterium]
MIDTAIIGAGPYGLSLAAHLNAAGADFRIFGKPLTSWRQNMPKGMMLKSDGFASNLSSPDPASTLKAWCAEGGVDYDDEYIPVPLSVFVDYSSWFQKRYVPSLEEHQVISVAKSSRGFTLWLDNGMSLEAANVVLAVGIPWFQNIPASLSALPRELLSHSFGHRELTQFSGKRVLVLGAGASAVNAAVMAQQDGVDVALLTRVPEIQFHTPPDPDAVSWLRAITHPSSGIGPGWRSFLCTNAPRLFRRMPDALRLRAIKRHLGPESGWYMRGKLTAQQYLGHGIEGARAEGDRAVLVARNSEGGRIEIAADHIIAGTGFKPDLRRLPFLASDLRDQISHLEHAPRLSDNFETSAPGLYAVGILAANTFGPPMRFMVGAEYAAPRLTAHLVKTASKARKVA